MAAFDIFELSIKGRGAHAAMPHLAVDPIVAAAQVISGLQTIASRNVDPLESTVVSVTQIHGGDTWNVIPERVVLRGTSRSFSSAVRDQIEPAIRRIADGACRACDAEMQLRYERRYPPTVNTATETEIAASAAVSLVGESNVRRNFLPSIGCGRLRLSSGKETGGLHLDRQRRRRTRSGAAQPALRFQRCGAAYRRELLGSACRDGAGQRESLRRSAGEMPLNRVFGSSIPLWATITLAKTGSPL